MKFNYLLSLQNQTLRTLVRRPTETSKPIGQSALLDATNTSYMVFWSTHTYLIGWHRKLCIFRWCVVVSARAFGLNSFEQTTIYSRCVHCIVARINFHAWRQERLQHGLWCVPALVALNVFPVLIQVIKSWLNFLTLYFVSVNASIPFQRKSWTSFCPSQYASMDGWPEVCIKTFPNVYWY